MTPRINNTTEEHEIFLRPFVSHVIFELKFSNLFYIEDRIGDFQVKILEKYEESSLLFRRNFLVGDVGPDFNLADAVEKNSQESKKIWQFSNEISKLNITSNSLDLSTKSYKNYRSSGDDSFRSLIDFVVEKFLEVTEIPKVSRLGLRYVNLCKIQDMNTQNFNDWYKTSLPIERFKLQDIDDMSFKTDVKINNDKMIYQEGIKKIKNEWKYVLDLDGYIENIDSSLVMETADRLHSEIYTEFNKNMKEPALDYMRRENE